MKTKEPKWESEAAMLAVFVEAAKSQGWRCYPETCGHDLILVAGPDVDPRCKAEPGDVVAVEGKLSLSMTVLRQALPPWRNAYAAGTERKSADFYAVVVPHGCGGGDPGVVAMALCIHVWEVRPARVVYDRPYPAEVGLLHLCDDYRCVGAPALEVHGLDVDMPAGLPSPRGITPWKINAVRLCLLGSTRSLTHDDFRHTLVRPRSFIDHGWMQVVSGVGKTAVFELVDAPTRPDRVYPELVAALAGEAAS